MSKIKNSGRALVGLLLVGALTGCVGPTPEQQTVALQFEGGIFIPTPRTFDQCVPGGRRGNYDLGGETSYYPSDQRFVDFTGDDRSDRAPVRVLSKDGVELEVPGQLQYTLNTDCAAGAESPIAQFDFHIGRRLGASFEDGPQEVPAGWREAQRLFVETPLETAMDRAAQNYVWRDLIFNPQIKAQWEKDVLAQLPDLVNRTTPTEHVFYQGFQPLIGVPQLVGEAGRQAQEAIVNGQRRVAEAQAREAEAAANQLAAEAEVAVAEAKSDAKRAEIKGYGTVNDYSRAKVSENGGNPFQPTYVVPQQR